MKLELLETNYIPKNGVWNGSYYNGGTKQKIYSCPCGMGTVVDEYDDIPGSRDQYTMIKCKECTKKYEIKNHLSSNWEIVEKNNNI